jgi:hypothetical protein
MFGFKIITQYEKGIVFRFGRALPGIREAGLTWVNPFTSREPAAACSSVHSSPKMISLARDDRQQRPDQGP